MHSGGLAADLREAPNRPPFPNLERRSATRTDLRRKSTTIKSLGARCAPARSISHGCRPPVITPILTSSRPAPARLGEAGSPNCPRPSQCCLLQQHTAARNLCQRTLLASVAPATRSGGARPWAVPGAHSPRAGATGYQRRGPPSARYPARLWPPSPQLAGQADIRRNVAVSAEPPPSRREARTDGSGQRTCRLERRQPPAPPLGPPRSSPRASLAGNRRAWPATSAAYHHASAGLPAGLALCDGIGIGDSGRAPGDRREGLDHWSSEARRRRPDVAAPFRGECPASGAGRAVFDKTRIAGSVRASNHGATTGTKRTPKNDLGRQSPRSERVRSSRLGLTCTDGAWGEG